MHCTCCESRQHSFVPCHQDSHRCLAEVFDLQYAVKRGGAGFTVAQEINPTVINNMGVCRKRLCQIDNGEIQAWRAFGFCLQSSEVHQAIYHLYCTCLCLSASSNRVTQPPLGRPPSQVYLYPFMSQCEVHQVNSNAFNAKPNNAKV